MTALQMCSVTGCVSRVASKKYCTLCPTHLYRWNKYKSYDLPEHLEPEVLPEGIIKKCKHHGYLKKEGIGSNNKCLACARDHAQRRRDLYPEKTKESNLRQRIRVKEMIKEFGSYEPKRRVDQNREIKFEKICKKHGLLDREQMIVREGKYLRCKMCHFEGVKDYMKRNPEKTKEIRRRNYLLNSSDASEKAILRNKKITKEQYTKLIDDHDNKCAICFQEETKRQRKDGTRSPLCIDHDHKTGLIRGLLCHMCNSGIGFFKDNEKILMNAAEYIRNHNDNRII